MKKYKIILTSEGRHLDIEAQSWRITPKGRIEFITGQVVVAFFYSDKIIGVVQAP